MINDIYALFRKTLPDIIRSTDTVMEILSDDKNHMICHCDDNVPAGFSVINDNVIYLLCVEDQHRNRGIGTLLLKKSEDYILSKGFENVVLGAGKDYIMPGVPMNNGAHLFFIKNGYTHSWGDCGCIDMSMILENYEYHTHFIGEVINGISYRWANINDLNKITKLMNEASEGFAEYYQNSDMYGDSSDTIVLIAEKGDEIIGAVMVCTEVERKGTGTLACLATAQKHRNKGIATTLMKLGTNFLKEKGMRDVFLGYTYTYIENIYAALGYTVCMEYFKGEKKLFHGSSG